VILYHEESPNYENITVSYYRFRHPNQIYAVLSQESPSNTVTDLTAAKKFFNVSLTYRSDSTIPLPYGHIQRRAERKSVSVEELMQVGPVFGAGVAKERNASRLLSDRAQQNQAGGLVRQQLRHGERARKVRQRAGEAHRGGHFRQVLQQVAGAVRGRRAVAQPLQVLPGLWKFQLQGAFLRAHFKL